MRAFVVVVVVVVAAGCGGAEPFLVVCTEAKRADDQPPVATGVVDAVVASAEDRIVGADDVVAQCGGHLLVDVEAVATDGTHLWVGASVANATAPKRAEVAPGTAVHVLLEPGNLIDTTASFDVFDDDGPLVVAHANLPLATHDDTAGFTVTNTGTTSLPLCSPCGCSSTIELAFSADDRAVIGGGESATVHVDGTAVLVDDVVSRSFTNIGGCSDSDGGGDSASWTAIRSDLVVDLGAP